MLRTLSDRYAKGNREKEYTALVLLGLSFAMAFAFAIVFVVVLVWSLPPTDGAYHSLLVFIDPFVLSIISMVASVSAAAIYPFVYLGLRDRYLDKSVTIISAFVILELVVATPMNARIGFIGSFAAFTLGLLTARLSVARKTPQLAGT